MLDTDSRNTKRHSASTPRRLRADRQTTGPPFRAAEKKYKARFPPLDLTATGVLRPSCSDPASQGFVEISAPSDTTPRVLTLPSVPGLVILPSFVSPQRQRDLVKWALSDHARPPNDTNLDTHYVINERGLWNDWLQARKDPSQDYLVPPRAVFSDNIGLAQESEAPGPRKLIDNEAASPETFHEISTTPKPPIPPSATIQPTLVSELVPKLRWANIGWYYHWGTKQYDFSKGKVDVDPSLASLCKEAVRAVDWQNVHGSLDGDWGPGGPDWHTWEDTYEPDAGIVNFYQERDTLMAHVDRSEVCATSPLVSISLGSAAIFLIGGLTRDVEPVAILLSSGDTVIMSGPSCRRAYHGVPRILAGVIPSHLKSQEDPEWEPYREYLEGARININVRQVFPKGFDPFASN